MKADKAITVEVSLDRKTFRDFALFDTFVLKKRWIRPAVFCGIMTVFAIAALLIGKEQSALIAGVLFAVGIGLPAVYIISFLDQINSQAKKNRLSADRKIYTVTLGSEDIAVRHHRQEGETLSVKWNDIAGIYRRRSCVYIYTDKNKAFLLPDGQADVTDSELWEYISEHAADNDNTLK